MKSRVDVKDKKGKKNKYDIYKKTYDYKTDSLFKKMFVASPEWLKINMYRELVEPINNPKRLPKVGTRLALFNKFYETKFKTCNNREYNEITKDPSVKKVLQFIGNYVKGKDLINLGVDSAHNFFVKNIRNVGALQVSDYKVYAKITIIILKI